MAAPRLTAPPNQWLFSNRLILGIPAAPKKSIDITGLLGHRQSTILMPSKHPNGDECRLPEPAPPEFTLLTLEGAEADEALAKLAKALGHPARVRILRMLSRKETCVCSQIVDELPLAQSTVSEHLRILREAGLVRSSQDGPRIGYSINLDGLSRLKYLVALI